MEKTGPECQVCLRTPDSSLPFYCQTCGRNVLYEVRLKHAQTLLEKETLAKEINAKALSVAGEKSATGNGRAASRDVHEPPNRLSLEHMRSESLKSKSQAQAISAECQTLRAQLETLRGHASKAKKAAAQRASTLDSMQRALQKSQLESTEALEKEISSISTSWDRLHNRTAEARVFLCREVATLYGLQQRKRKKGAPGRDAYLIGGVQIIDLRDLNNADPEQVTTSISRVAHLLHLTAHYLGVRLPAEISLSTASQPYCLIHTPLSSYKTASMPSILRNHSSTPSVMPRQRVLQLDRPLHQLAAEEPINYSLFVDAITLLAWDIAWVAKTQGIEVGAKTWEEICALGKNMWTLFVAPRRPPTLRTKTAAVTAGKTLWSSPTQPPALPPSGQAPPKPGPVVPPNPGQFSHNSSHSFLSSSGPDGGAEHLRGWRFANPVRIIDRIKSALLNERTGAEWEVLEKPESDGADDGNSSTSEAAATAQDTEPVQKTAEGSEEAGEPSGKSKARQGWTKLRSPTTDT